MCTALDPDAYGRIIATCTAGEVSQRDNGSRGTRLRLTRFSEDYVAVQADAKAGRVGIWAGSVEAPWTYRANGRQRATAASPREGCPIKGNISPDDERIYHTPWSPWYGRTQIDEASGEHWFCDEAEARAAGWRAARWK